MNEPVTFFRDGNLYIIEQKGKRILLTREQADALARAIISKLYGEQKKK